MRSKKKGFTLLEMIIVVAIFSLIMFSVVQLLDPVSKFFVRSSNFESANACLDNMDRAIEGNLKYADRVRVYAGFEPYTGDGRVNINAGNVSNNLKSHVSDFYNQFFEGRRFLGCRGRIHVLIFDNTTDPNALNGFSLTDFASNKYNQGQIMHLSFGFDNYDGAKTAANVLANGTYENWYVNQKLYGTYDYRFAIGESNQFLDVVTTTSTTTTTAVTTTTTPDPAATTTSTTVDPNATMLPSMVFNPSDFVIQVSMAEIRRDATAHCLVREPLSDKHVCGFTMKNVLDNTATYAIAGQDFKLKYVNPAIADERSAATIEGYYVDSYINRYEPMVKNTNTALNGPVFDGFYVIFTLPEDVDNLPDFFSMSGSSFDSYIVTTP